MANELGECKQLQLLRVAIRMATIDVVNSLSVEEGKTMLAEVNHIKDKKKEMLVNMLKETIVSDVETAMNEIFEEEEFDKHLRDRETIVKEQECHSGKPTWRPTGSVADDMRSRDMHMLKKKIEQVEIMCQNKMDEVNQLRLKVNETRNEILGYQRNLDDANKNFETLKSHIEDEEAANIRMTKSLYNDQIFS